MTDQDQPDRDEHRVERTCQVATNPEQVWDAIATAGHASRQVLVMTPRRRVTSVSRLGTMRIRTVTALVMLVCGSVASGGIEQLGVAAARPEVADAPIVGDPFAPLPIVTGPTGVTRRVLATTPDRSIAVYQEGMSVRAVELDGGDSWLLSPVDNTVDPPNFVEISPDGQYVLVPRRSPDRLVSVPILGGPATDVTGDLGINGLNASNVTDVPGTGDLVFRRLTASMARSRWAGGTPQTVTPSLAPGRFIIAGARVSPEGTWLLYPTSGAGEQNRTLEAVNLTTLTPRTLLGTADLGLSGFVTGIVFPAGGQTVVYSAGLNGNRTRLYRQNLSSGPAMQSDDLPAGAGNVSQVAITADRLRVIFGFRMDPALEGFEIRSVAATGFIAGTFVSVSGGRVVDEFAQSFFTMGTDRVAYTVALPGGTTVVRTGRIDAPEIHTLMPNQPPGTYSDVQSFTPDGTRVVFRGNFDAANVYDLFAARADGGDAPVKINHKVVAPVGEFGEPFPYEVDPTGRWLAYSVYRGSSSGIESFVGALDGSGATPVALGPPGSAITFLQWMPLAVPGPQSLFYSMTDGVTGGQDQIVRAFRSPVGASRFVPLPPRRILDTRPGEAQVGYSGDQPGQGATVSLQVFDRGGVPASGVSAVVLNITGTEALAAGFVTVWPGGTARPVASSLNLESAGQTRPNLVTVPVGADGTVQIFTQLGAHFVADVLGYYTPAPTATAGRYRPLAPLRLLDTRPGPTQIGYAGDKPGQGAVVDLAVAGRGGVPLAGAAAVVLNVTATEATAKGFVTVWPDGARPTASNLNVDTTGQTVPNQVIVPLGADGHIRLFSQSGTHLIVDVAGWFTDASAPLTFDGTFVPVQPARILDTRADTQVGYSGAKPGTSASVVLAVAGRGGVSLSDAAAVVANVTATEANAAGFVTAWPSGVTPVVSNLNLDRPDQTISNQVTSPLGNDGALRLFTQSGTHLVVDVTGWYLGSA